MYVVHGRYARCDQLERREQGVEIRVDITMREPCGKRRLERLIVRPELERRHPYMMVRVDETREQNVIGRTDYRNLWMLRAKPVDRADVDDDPVALIDPGVAENATLFVRGAPHERGAPIDDRSSHQRAGLTFIVGIVYSAYNTASLPPGRTDEFECMASRRSFSRALANLFRHQRARRAASNFWPCAP